MILTAIIHPEGQAPFWQPPLQYLGKWLTTGPASKFPKAIAQGRCPACIPGVLLGMWLIVGAKATEFRNWHLLLAAVVGLIGRGIGMQIVGAASRTRRAPEPHGHGAHGHGASTPSDSTPALAEA